MKVLFLTNIPSPYRVDFFSELGKLCDLTVIYEREAASDRNISWKGQAEDTFRQIFLKGKKVGTDNSFSWEIIKYLRQERYDHYIVGMYSTFTAMLAILYFRWKKIPYILNTDGGFISEDSFLKEKIKRYFIGGAAYWLSTGQNANRYLIHYGAKEERIYTYPFSSLREEDIRQEEREGFPVKERARQELKIQEKKMILSVGQMIHRKGMDVLIRGAALLDREVGVYLIGGEPNEEVCGLVEELNLTNVHFPGFMTKERLQEYYKAADLFVLPTREDIWGLVINEAMAQGLPIITTRHCGAGLELVEEGINGFLVEKEDEQALANRIELVLENEKLKESMSEASLKKIEAYTVHKMAKRHGEILSKLKNEEKQDESNHMWTSLK